MLHKDLGNSTRDAGSTGEMENSMRRRDPSRWSGKAAQFPVGASALCSNIPYGINKWKICQIETKEGDPELHR